MYPTPALTQALLLCFACSAFDMLAVCLLSRFFQKETNHFNFQVFSKFHASSNNAKKTPAGHQR